MLDIGTKAPDFSLPDPDGQMHALSAYRGRKVILYFYPADMSPGCTSQACGFRDLYPQIREKGAVVLGVNADSVESHKQFMEEHGLPFLLLSDPDKEVLQAYDVWKQKLMFGRPVMGIERSTYLIDEEGVIVKAFGKVKPKDNAKQMLKELI
ncbi:MAG: thioredoxin-dependent thiol peroxidase [Erysipelotrichaceae bacterium]|nr:thioredoxin-dependent thiol peroxidase [Erysipelotrichaceae bacterium]